MLRVCLAADELGRARIPRAGQQNQSRCAGLPVLCLTAVVVIGCSRGPQRSSSLSAELTTIFGPDGVAGSDRVRVWWFVVNWSEVILDLSDRRSKKTT